MRKPGTDRTIPHLRWLLATVLLGTTSLAIASVPAPNIVADSTTGYTVSYSPCTGCYAHGIEERVGANSAWAYAGSGTLHFSGQAPGTYEYRVVYAQVSASMQVVLAYSSIRSIVIGGASPPAVDNSLEGQLDQSYAAFRADLDGDGRDEILLERQTTGASGGMPAAVLVGRDTTGNATAAGVDATAMHQRAVWYPAGLDVLTRDVNVDGYADLVVREVDGLAGLALDRNQIVFGPGSETSGPTLQTRSVDDGLIRFSRDINRHLIDPEYYPTHAPLRYARIVYYSLNCVSYSSAGGVDAWLGTVLPWPCIVQPNYYYVVYRDFSVFDDDAMFVASHDYGMMYGIVPADSGMELIRLVLSRVLGIGIGGWDVEELLGNGDDGALANEAERKGLDLFVVLAGISDAVAQQEGSAEQAGATTAGSGPDRVLIKGRRVLGGGPMHSVLEYRYATISAYDSNPSVWIDGRLVSQMNWPRDHPALTMRLGYVDGSVGPASYWATLVQADSRYDDDLPYDLFPSIGQGGYNSNSFTAGLIDATLGTPTVSMSTLVGGERPVPASEFN